MLLTIQPAFAEVAPGTYKADFVGMSHIETKNGPAYRWAFKADDGRILSGLSDAAAPPSPKNKTGRWLAALSGKPLLAGTQVNPDDHVNAKYLVIFSPADNGSRLETFAKI